MIYNKTKQKSNEMKYGEALRLYFIQFRRQAKLHENKDQTKNGMKAKLTTV